MKRALSGLLQFIFFFVVFAVGSLLPGAHVLPELSFPVNPGRIFVYDGLLLMLLAYIILALIAVLRKRLRHSLPISTTALALALILGLALKFGFKSI
jgi:hypothetical protein